MGHHHEMVALDGQSLTIEDLVKVAELGCKVDIKQEIKDKINSDRQRLERQLRERPDVKIYGTNVLHGDLKDKEVPLDLIEEYQNKYIKVHNCGTGAPLPIEIIRAIMLIRLNSFAKAKSGIKLDTCQLMIDMLNNNVTPWVLEEGSVGASGDLIPLAMIGAVMIGLPEAKAYYCDDSYYTSEIKPELKPMPVDEAFAMSGFARPTEYKLGAKEAMGITNGSNFIAAVAAFTFRDSVRLLNHADYAASVSLEAIRGEQNAFGRLINDNRPHEGQLAVADHMRGLIEGSQRMTQDAQKHCLPGQNPKTAQVRVQDRYSYRAVPVVHGAAYEALQKYRSVIETEINSATDNPLFDFDLPEEELLQAHSGANFHGQPLAAVIDYVKTTITALSLISDKRSFSMLDHALSYGLPADLAYDTSTADGGLMLTQYAGAARAAENRVLSTPASVMSLSTSANQEDFVSMGSIGVIHLRKIIENTQLVLAVEMLCAARGIQMTGDKLPVELRGMGKGSAQIFAELDKIIGPAGPDHYLRTDMEALAKLIKSDKLSYSGIDCMEI